MNHQMNEWPCFNISSEPTPSPLDPAPDISGTLRSQWAEIAETIREDDEQKIKKYRDELDSVLVFAGLFSAVLSALLAISYQSLQPNPDIVMIALLRQMVTQTQSYHFSAGFLNSTAGHSADIDLPQSPPPVTLQWLNAFWFASLTLSLISASFAILVKQWIREYLIDSYPSAQARVRAQLFRAPGLYDWKVFEFGGFLMLLLQLSLALFFAGLCMFTSAVNRTLGYAVIPSICGWAFLFAAVSFSPALSPRCPYKLPFMKPITEMVRIGLRFFIHRIRGVLQPTNRPEDTGKEVWVDDMIPGSWRLLEYNEELAVKDAGRDVDILVQVDRSRTDDELVMKMSSALKELRMGPKTMVDFVLGIIASRIPTLTISRPVSEVLDLSQLPARTSTILMDIVAEALQREVKMFLDAEPITWTETARDCIILLFARLPCLLSDKATEVVSLCFADTHTPRWRETSHLILTTVSESDAATLCQRLHRRLLNTSPQMNFRQFLGSMNAITKGYCGKCGKCDTVQAVLKAHEGALPLDLKQQTWDIVAGYLLDETRVTWGEQHQQISVALYEHWYAVGESGNEARKLVHRLLTTPELARNFAQLLFSRDHHSVAAEKLFISVFRSSQVQDQILLNVHATFTTYLDDMFKQPAHMDDKFRDKLLYFVERQVAEMLYMSINRSAATQPCLSLWQNMWGHTALHTALRRPEFSPSTKEQRRCANTCLTSIDSLDDLWLLTSPVPTTPTEDFDKWVATFDPSRSFFNDDIVEGLLGFLPSPHDTQCKRVRRILSKRQAKLRRRVERGAKKNQKGHLKPTAGADADDAVHSPIPTIAVHFADEGTTFEKTDMVLVGHHEEFATQSTAGANVAVLDQAGPRATFFRVDTESTLVPDGNTESMVALGPARHC